MRAHPIPGHDLDQSVPAVLERLGRFLSAGRAYLGLVREELVYNDFEWCAEQMEPQRMRCRGALQLIGRWLPIFARQECVILEDLEPLKELCPGEYELLRAWDIHSLVAAPLEQDGKLRGLLGSTTRRRANTHHRLAAADAVLLCAAGLSPHGKRAAASRS